MKEAFLGTGGLHNVPSCSWPFKVDFVRQMFYFLTHIFTAEGVDICLSVNKVSTKVLFVTLVLTPFL